MFAAIAIKSRAERVLALNSIHKLREQSSSARSLIWRCSGNKQHLLSRFVCCSFDGGIFLYFIFAFFFFNINVIRMSYWHKVLRDTISRKLFFLSFQYFFPEHFLSFAGRCIAPCSVHFWLLFTICSLQIWDQRTLSWKFVSSPLLNMDI